MGGLVVLAWLALWAWERSPYGRYLDHGELGALRPEQGVAGLLLPGVLYVAGWVLMIVAMMLPTVLPLAEIFRRLTLRHREHSLLMALLLAGYLACWTAFGIAAHVGDWGLHEAVERVPFLAERAWTLGAMILLLAGLFQFTPLKYACLDKCRAPLSFVLSHWRGKRERWQAFLLGLRHGLFCVGCCWALMLVMFAVGTGNVGWMLVLGAVMAGEKNLPWGRRLGAPVGIVLAGWGLAILLGALAPAFP